MGVIITSLLILGTEISIVYTTFFIKNGAPTQRKLKSCELETIVWLLGSGGPNLTHIFICSILINLILGDDILFVASPQRGPP